MEMEEYHTLAVYDEEMGQWFDEFGSYLKGEVREEEAIAREHYGLTRIVTTDGTQEALVSALKRLNYQF